VLEQQKNFIFWHRDLKKILIGQNAMTGLSRYAMARRLLDGDALAAFDRAAAQLEEETAENFEDSLNALAVHVFP
jgi:hypothetical protein